MFQKIKAIEPKDNFMLCATFENGEVREYDVKPLFDEIPDFEELKLINGLFKQVKVDVGGYGIVWNSRIDLSSDEIYEHGKVVEHV